MAIYPVSSSITTYASRTNTTVTAPTGIQDGDYLLAQIVTGSGSEAPDPTAPSGFSQIGSTVDQTGAGPFNVEHRCYGKRASGESGDYTWTHSSASSQASVSVFRGVDPVTAEDQISTSNTGSGTTRTWTGLTTVTNGAMIVALGHDWGDTSNNLVPPTGMAECAENGIICYVACEEVPTAGATGNRSHTCNSGSQSDRLFSARLVALRPQSYSPNRPVVQSRTSARTTAADTTSHAITLPGSIVAGELLLCVFSVDGNPTVSVNTGVSGSNWTILGQASNSTIVTGAIVWKIAEGSDVLTLTTSASEQSSHITMRISNASGITGTSANGSSTNSNPPSHSPTPGTRDYLWIATRSGDSTTLATDAPQMFKDLQSLAAAGTGGASSNTAERFYPASSLDPGTFVSATEQWVSWTLAVAPNVAPPFAPPMQHLLVR